MSSELQDPTAKVRLPVVPRADGATPSASSPARPSTGWWWGAGVALFALSVGLGWVLARWVWR